MSAGELETPIKVEKRKTSTTDKYGRGSKGWEQRIERTWARKRARAGTEQAQAARVESRVPYEFLVRDDPDTRTISVGDRIRDLETLETFNVTAAAPFEKDRDFRLITALAGGADG